MEYNNVFGTTGDPHKTIPEPEKKDQMEYLANHGGHRKPGSLLPAQDDQFSNHVEEITQTHFETKTTLRPVSLPIRPF